MFVNFVKQFGVSKQLSLPLHDIALTRMCPIGSYTRSLSVSPEDDVVSKSINYRDTSSDYQYGRKVAVKKLQELFKIKLHTAVDLAVRFKKLQSTMVYTISDNYNLLINAGIPQDVILKYPDILTYKELEEKLNLIKMLSYSVGDLAPLLNFELKVCKEFIQPVLPKDDFDSRIKHLSNLFRLPVMEICDILTKRRFLCKIDLTRVERNYKLLIEYGISCEEIQKDFWVLQYSTESIKRRLETAKELKADKIKTWMVRAQQEVFNRYIQRRYDNKLILGNNSVAEYLVNKLKCSMDRSNLILSKHPALLNKSMKKIDLIIDFIIAQGFTPQHIVRSPKVLLHGFETTKKRLKEIKDLDANLDSLHILTKSQKQYMLFYDSLLKNKIKD